MKCNNYKYKILKGNNYGKWGTIKDWREKKAIAIECGKCKECKLKRMLKWKAKLEMEAITNKKKNGTIYFVTLTYDNSNIIKIQNENQITQEVQKWFKRIRNNNKPNKIKYFGVTELGGQTGRQHHHILIYSDKDIFKMKPGSGKKIKQNYYWQAENINWKNGYHSIIKIGENKKTIINYVLKYVLKNPLNYYYSKQLGKEEMLERGNLEKGTFMLNGLTYKITGHKQDMTNAEIIENNYITTKNKKSRQQKEYTNTRKELITS